MMKSILAFAVVAGFSVIASADDHQLAKVCKAECPTAKDNHEAHACLDKIPATKKDAKWKSSACGKAYTAHEAHEAKGGEKHDDHKH